VFLPRRESDKTVPPAGLAGAIAALVGLIEEFPQTDDLRALPFLDLTVFFLPLFESRPNIRGKTGV